MGHSYTKICEQSLSVLSSRAQDCVRRRFGIGYDKPQTLDAIGKQHNITRERVRQVIRASLQQINAKAGKEYQAAQSAIEAYVKKQGGIVFAPRLFKTFVEKHGAEEGVVRFFIAASDRVDLIDKHRLYPVEQSIHVVDFDFDSWKKVHDHAYDFLKKKSCTCEQDELYAILAKTQKSIDAVHVKEHLHAAKKIAKNPYGKWGIASWNDVTPRSIRDKVRLILEYAEEPLHFRDIAKAIDEKDMNKHNRKTHPQTVHNELIKDRSFVLVGRGTYALASKGYMPGKVRDLVVAILEKASEPLTAQEIVDGVLAQRSVKPATVKINLHAVAKNNNGTYTLK